MNKLIEDLKVCCLWRGSLIEIAEKDGFLTEELVNERAGRAIFLLSKSPRLEEIEWANVFKRHGYPKN